MQTKCLSDRMKSLSAKRITAMIAGAALLGVGLAFSGPVSFSSVPIISNSGQPVVQVVLGSSAKPSDYVAAANIAAAIGNLAFTTMPVTASINTTQAQSVLHVSVSSPTYSLTNQQVWLNESASALTSGTYGFSTLIGSVLNGGIQLGSLQSTKNLQGPSQYSYPETPSTSATPAPSPYTGVSFVPLATSVVAANNGGGASFSTFQSGTSPAYDNILEVSHSQFSGLLSNAGSYGENEYLWLTGFPVYDQASGVNNFALLDANGAYQITFNKPINVKTSSGSINHAAFSLLGQNYTVINYTPPANFLATSPTNFTTGGSMYIASSLTPLTTVYVGSNLTSGGFKVVLNDLGQPNSNGVSPAAISVYYNGALTNTSSIMPPNTTKFNVSGHYLYVKVNQTFAGLYAYEKWAKMQLYSNVFQIKSGSSFNTTTNPNWYTVLQWVNASGSTNTVSPNALQSIVIYGTSSEAQTLLPGQSFSFITSPAVWKLQFIGQTLGSANYDPVTATLSAASPFTYENKGTQTPPSGSVTFTIKNVTEPAQELTVTSSIPNAFSYAGQTSSSVVYDLTPYELNEANVVTYGEVTTNSFNEANVTLTFKPGYNSLISSTYPLYVTVTGYLYKSNTVSGPQSKQVTFNGILNGPPGSYSAYNNSISVPFYNITGIELGSAIPGIASIEVEDFNSIGVPFSGNTQNAGDTITATLSAAGALPTGTTITFSTTPGTSNSITFPSQVVTNGGSITATGHIQVTASNSPSSGNTISITGGNILISGTITLNSQNGQSIAFSGNVVIPSESNFIANNMVTNSIPVNAVMSVTETGITSATILGNVPVYGSTIYSNSLANTISVPTTENVVASGTYSPDPVVLATLASTTGPGIIYTPAGSTVPSLYGSSSTPLSVIYNQQNGLPTESFTLAPVASVTPTPGSLSQYYTYTMNELAVPGNTAAIDSLAFGIDNSTGGIGVKPLFQLNYSVSGSSAPGTHNNMTYTSTSGSSIKVQSGFITEKGSKVASITPTSLTVDFAKAVDELQFAVAPVSTTISKTYKLFGPYGIGQATNLPNVSIGAVNATITLSGTSKYTITGINNITATPTVSSADVPTLLKSLPTSPLVVLDTQVTNPSGSLILIGSGYVNTLSAQLQKAYNITMTPSTQIVQAYGNKILIAGYYANQTTAAANQFISDLYAAASTT